MALNYRKCAEEIAANIGGGSNIISAAHCATRLRLVIADNSKVNSATTTTCCGRRACTTACTPAPLKWNKQIIKKPPERTPVPGFFRSPPQAKIQRRRRNASSLR